MYMVRSALGIASALIGVVSACNSVAPTRSPDYCLVQLGGGVTPGNPVLGIGDTVTLKISFTSSSSCVPLPSEVRWEVIDTTIAQIGEMTGLLTGKAVGTSAILAWNTRTGAPVWSMEVTVN